MKRTIQQNKAIHSLSHQLGWDDEQRHDMVHQYTGGRTERSSEMTESEAREMIRAMKQVLNQPTFKPRNAHEGTKERKRKRVISHLAEAGYVKTDGQPDMDAIHDWVRRQKYKKPLNAHTSQELSTLIYAADAVRQHFLTKIKTDE